MNPKSKKIAIPVLTVALASSTMFPAFAATQTTTKEITTPVITPDPIVLPDPTPIDTNVLIKTILNQVNNFQNSYNALENRQNIERANFDKKQFEDKQTFEKKQFNELQTFTQKQSNERINFVSKYTSLVKNMLTNLIKGPVYTNKK